MDPAKSAEAAPLPKATAFLLATCADLYRQELAAEEDVHRTLPFFGTALGVIFAALVYAAGKLPKLPDLTTHPGKYSFFAAAVFLALAVLEAVCVLVWVSIAMAGRPYRRIGPATALRKRMDEDIAWHQALNIGADEQDTELVRDLSQFLLESYTEVTTVNRVYNERRYRARAKGASHLVRSLICALCATIIISVADKLFIW